MMMILLFTQAAGAS